jgi:hypothetical protein
MIFERLVKLLNEYAEPKAHTKGMAGRPIILKAAPHPNDHSISATVRKTLIRVKKHIEDV